MIPHKVKALAVIGANYGDEGKGAVVNALSRQYKPEYVIRFNGGGQAGHTVQLEDGTRHVFSTLGSGTFYGAKTYYTEDVLVSQGRILEEFQVMDRLIGGQPYLDINQHARVITDLDIIANQFGELLRRDAGLPHGTCGMGIGECVQRHLRGGPISPFWSSHSDPEEDRRWFERRLGQISGETGVPLDKYQNQINSALSIWGNTPLHRGWGPTIRSVTEPRFTSLFPTVIFEGAQGLLLDEDDPDHQPHVTWSKTGLANVIKECKKHGWDLDAVYYVTRPYLTRHGEGPMHAALADKPGNEIQWGEDGEPLDGTNVTNKWQGSLRKAPMDWTKFHERVSKDYQLAEDAFPEDPPDLRFAVTCSDQVTPYWAMPGKTIDGRWGPYPVLYVNGLKG